MRSRFAVPSTRRLSVPLNVFGKVGSASALEPLPRASSCPRPAVRLFGFDPFGPPPLPRWLLPVLSPVPAFAFPVDRSGHELKLSCFPSRTKRKPPVDKLYIGDKFGAFRHLQYSQGLSRELPRPLLDLIRFVHSARTTPLLPEH